MTRNRLEVLMPDTTPIMRPAVRQHRQRMFFLWVLMVSPALGYFIFIGIDAAARWATGY